MAGKPDIDGVSLRMEAVWTDAEQRIMADIVRRIKKAGEITSTADYQINRLIEMGKSTEEIERILKETLNATWPEMFELYDNAANWQYVRNKDVYEQVNGHFTPPEDNEWLKQTSDAVKEQTKDNLENIAKSYGFAVMMGSRKVFMPFATYYQKYVDAAIMDVISGGFDYNSVIRRVVTQMTNSGLRTVDYASGHSSRVDVAVRRSILTGVSQITGKVNERNASELDTEYFEVDWHPAARPDHQKWQGKVYSKDELRSVCGLGTVTGLCGANCRHTYYPFIPGVSERMYTDEWLEEQNRKEAETKEWQGKELNAYEQTQQQRKMETAMRAQREKVQLLKEAGADKDDIMIARAKYQAQLDEYGRYCKKMGLPEQRERIYQDMRGRVAPDKEAFRKTAAEANGKYSGRSTLENLTKWGSSKARQRTVEQKNSGKPVEKDAGSGIIKTKDRFHSKDDPMFEVMGAARKNNAGELQKVLTHLEELQVKVKYRDGQYGYEIIGKGIPGEIIIDENASLSAWLHEYQHALDDFEAGWSSKRILKNPGKRYRREERAYQVEINLAKKMKRDDMVKRLESNLEHERRRIYGE